MPELPDLLYIKGELERELVGRRVTSARLVSPVLLRALVEGGLGLLVGARLERIERVAHFLLFSLSGQRPMELAVNPMLAGRFRVATVGDKDEGSLGFALGFEATELRYLDDRQMGKVYLLDEGNRATIPALPLGGLYILGPDFTLDVFAKLIAARRDQVRVFLMDKSAIDALGNAYADEVLFAACLHPKTPCRKLSFDDVARLHNALVTVMRAAVAEVARRKAPTEEKIRDFLQVRLRTLCPRCGHKVRKAGVHGQDSYFCPHCQPLDKPLGQPSIVDWRKTGK